MGLFKLLLMAFAAYVVYRYVIKGWLNSSPSSSSDSSRASSKTKTQPQSPAVKDKMIPCPTCGTYNPSHLALQVGKYYYCGQECLEKKK